MPGQVFNLLLMLTREDFDSLVDVTVLNLRGRIFFEPLGWYDKKAKNDNESIMTMNRTYSPRDMFGTVFQQTTYDDRDKMHQLLIYISAIKRVIKLPGTATQDKMKNQDGIGDDGTGFGQKLTPSRYPYTFEVIGEREYLMPAGTLTGSGWFKSEGKEFRDCEFERRPVYVLKLTQLDPNYAYGHRIIYFDRETFAFLGIENYDQKGRLHRTHEGQAFFHPGMGMFFPTHMVFFDHIDFHSTWQRAYAVPVPFLTRDHVGIRQMVVGK